MLNRYAVFRTLYKEDFPKRSIHDLFMGTFENIIKGQAYSIRMNKRYPEQRFYLRILHGEEIEKYNKMAKVRISVDS
mgnify:CR=1 FL=1